MNKFSLGALIVVAIIAISAHFVPEARVIEKTVVEKNVGSVAGPDTFYEYYNRNGVIERVVSIPVNPTGSTTCSIALPPGAGTSTVFASGHFTRLASSTMVELGIGDRMATTTSLGKATFPTGGGLLYSSSTPMGTIIPGQYVNFKIGSGDLEGTLDPVGVCKAVFRQLAN